MVLQKLFTFTSFSLSPFLFCVLFSGARSVPPADSCCEEASGLIRLAFPEKPLVWWNKLRGRPLKGASRNFLPTALSDHGVPTFLQSTITQCYRRPSVICRGVHSLQLTIECRILAA
ncbi:hypothetical protein BC834DRAFT_44830 [Gloeopeniophorella convolvens]|nr:hypothetical protein BC834DRAFT_44830 [Gloeopeniophorella convolvens]